MARWTDLATWRGPSPNINEDEQTEVRGLVVHIAAGWYEGTIAWQRNRDSGISSHFVVGRDGQIAQMVDTSDKAWTQRSGNGEWLSVECEGFIKSDSKNPGGWERLSDKQIDAVARILARCHEVYDVPLQVTSSATGRGLGHHSMGADWGHRECPGAPIIAQKPAIVDRARAITNGGNDMPLTKDDLNQLWNGDGVIKAPDSALARDPKNTHWGASSIIRYTYDAAVEGRAEVRAVKLLAEATLKAVQGIDSGAIIAAVNARAAEDAKRDAALLAELQGLVSGGATAQDILDQLAARLSGVGE